MSDDKIVELADALGELSASEWRHLIHPLEQRAAHNEERWEAALERMKHLDEGGEDE